MEILQCTQEQHKDLIESLQLPKAELIYYSGDPLSFWEFWRSFETNTDNISVNDSTKLTKLLHSCIGEEPSVIKACSVMEPTVGYARTKELLQ